MVAKEEGRSLNSEVVKRIERSLKEDGFIKQQ
ncbi:Arc family DNA-binding protein [Edwardsiella tarda]